MAVTANSIITPQAPYAAFADMQTASAVTTRANLAASTTLTALLPFTNTNGMQINSIQVKGTSTAIGAPTAAQTVLVYEYDGTSKYWLVDEIAISLVTPSTTAPSFFTEVFYSGWIIPASHTLWVATTIATGAATTAFSVCMQGGAL